jgi:hypothetical protein
MRVVRREEACYVSDHVHLKIAVAEYPHTSAVRDGSIPIEGVDAEIVDDVPGIDDVGEVGAGLQADPRAIGDQPFGGPRYHPIFEAASLARMAASKPASLKE